MRPHFASLATLALVGSAHADVANRNLFPIGEQEAFRANAGIAGSSPGSVSAVFRAGSATTSASGSACSASGARGS